QTRSRLTDEHPRVQALRARIEAMERVVATKAPSTETDDFRPTITQEASRNRQEALDNLALEARQRVERLSAIDDEASALLAAVQIAEGHKNQLQQTLIAAQDKARSPVTGFRVAAPAAVADEPVESGKRWALVLVALTGCVLL